MKQPRGFLFDFGETLLVGADPTPQAGAARMLALAHNPRGVTLEQYEAVSLEPGLARLWDARLETPIEFQITAFLRLVHDLLGLTFDLPDTALELEFWKAMVHYGLPEPVDALRLIRDSGIPFGVVSNSSFSASALRWELKRHGILDLFEFVMSSADYVVRKPHPALFLAAATKLGCEPPDIWFVGDSLKWDIAGALGVGMTAIWCNRNGLPPQGICPSAEIASWEQLAALIRECTEAA